MAKRRKQPKRVPGALKTVKKPKSVDRFTSSPPVDGKIRFLFWYFDDGFRPAEQVGRDCFYEIGSKLKNIAISAWKELRQNTKHHHGIDLYKLTSLAQKRLQELEFDDLDEVFSLRLTGKQRVFGVVSEPYFYVLWWDPHHQVCLSKKKGT